MISAMFFFWGGDITLYEIDAGRTMYTKFGDDVCVSIGDIPGFRMMGISLPPPRNRARANVGVKVNVHKTDCREDINTGYTAMNGTDRCSCHECVQCIGR